MGYDGLYDVSNLGRIRSHHGRYRRDGAAYILKPGGDRYLKVTLHMDRCMETPSVHVLVAEAFLGPRPDGMEVCHNDGDPHNNSADNLRYDDRLGNAADTVAHGTSNRGEMSPHHKITEADVRAIRADAASGRRSRRELAAAYGLSKTGIQRIISRQNWGWLPD